jgi:hypothetical protein
LGWVNADTILPTRISNRENGHTLTDAVADADFVAVDPLCVASLIDGRLEKGRHVIIGVRYNDDGPMEVEDNARITIHNMAMEMK